MTNTKRKYGLKCLPVLLLFLIFLGACTPAYGIPSETQPAPAGFSEAEQSETAKTVAEGTVVQQTAPPAETVEAGEEADALPKADQSGRYCYELLNGDEQVWYEDMYAVLSGMETEKNLDEAGIETIGELGIDRIFQCVMNDHPELFFVKGYTYTLYTYGSQITRISFSGTYTMDAAEREKRETLIAAAVDKCLSYLDKDASDYTKVKYVYDYLILNTEYSKQAEDNQNICSVFIGRQSVCQGYAKATQYLLEKLGIPATLVIGTVYSGESHAWNLVQLDGEWYYVDTTWGDASYQMTEEDGNLDSGSIPSINYDYLCVTTDQLLKTHTIDNIVPLPDCVSMAANYYVQAGAYFTAYEEAAVAEFFEKGYETGRSDITLKCADAEVYNTFLEQLITNQKIFDYMNSPDGVVAYAEDADKLSLTFWLVNE